MMNSRGAVLGVTMCFMVFFVLMGMGALSLSGAQGLGTVQRVATTQAFWLADAGIETGRYLMEHSMPTSYPYPHPIQSMGEGNYDMQIKYATCLGTLLCKNKWVVTSVGKTLDGFGGTRAQRTIEAVVSRYGIEDALTTNGDIKLFDPENPSNLPGNLKVLCPDGSCNDPAQQGELLNPNAGITFQSVFGLNLNDVWDGLIIDNPVAAINYSGSGDIPIAEHVTYVKTTSDISITIPVEAEGTTVFLIIQDTSSSGGEFNVTMNGNQAFTGVMWIQSNRGVKLNGTADVVGAVLATTTDLTKALGDLTLTFDMLKIDEAVGYLDGVSSTTPHLTSWKEI